MYLIRARLRRATTSTLSPPAATTFAPTTSPTAVLILTLALALALVLVLPLAACGEGSQGISADRAGSTPTPTAPHAPTEAAAASAGPSVAAVPEPIFGMPTDLCAIVDWNVFADLYPGQAREPFGQQLRIVDPSWMSQVECLTGYGDAGNRSAVLVTVKVEVFKETLLARIAYDGIKRVDLAHAGQTFKDVAVVGPGSGYTYLDAALGLRLVARHANLVITATLASLWHPSTIGPGGSLPADSTARLTRLTAALFTTMPHTPDGNPGAGPGHTSALEMATIRPRRPK